MRIMCIVLLDKVQFDDVLDYASKINDYYT